MNPVLAVTIVSIVAIVCACALAGYIVHITGSTTGMVDAGKLVGALLVAAIASLRSGR